MNSRQPIWFILKPKKNIWNGKSLCFQKSAEKYFRVNNSLKSTETEKVTRRDKFDSISLFNGILTFLGYLKPISFLWKNCSYNKEVITFPNDISPKMKLIARLVF